MKINNFEQFDLVIILNQIFIQKKAKKTWRLQVQMSYKKWKKKIHFHTNLMLRIDEWKKQRQKYNYRKKSPMFSVHCSQFTVHTMIFVCIFLCSYVDKWKRMRMMWCVFVSTAQICIKKDEYRPELDNRSCAQSSHSHWCLAFQISWQTQSDVTTTVSFALLFPEN